MPKLYRSGGYLILEDEVREDNKYLAHVSGVEIVGRILYRKSFPGDRFLTDRDQIVAAIKQHREGNNVVLLGFSGYSDLNEKRCADLNIRVGEYEKASVGLIEACVHGLRRELGNPTIKFVHGSSDMGIDQSIEAVCLAMECERLGFSCPEYLWWVNSATGPTVCVMTKENALSPVGTNEQAYCDAYVQAVDILFAANGGKVSYEMDVRAATLYHKRVVILDVLRTLGARIQGFDQSGKVLDAAAAFVERFHIIHAGDALFQSPNDIFKATREALVERIVGLARNIVSPEMAYGFRQ